MRKGLKRALRDLKGVIGENKFAFKLFSIKMAELPALAKTCGDEDFQLGVRSTHMVVTPVIDRVELQHKKLVAYQEAHGLAGVDGVPSSQDS